MSRSRRTLSRTLAATACVLCAANASHADTATSTTDSVNVFVGTAGHGHTYPGATVPFGFVQLSPDTRVNTWDGASGYHYSDKTIDGFSHTHLSGTGVGDLGDVLLMPVTGALQSGDTYKPLASDRFVSSFSHDRESAAPGYYRVMLDRYGVLAELTATAHAGMHRYTFPSDQPGHVIVDLVHGIGNHATAGSVSVDGPATLSGWRTTDGWAGNRTVYFVLQASRPWSQAAFEAEGKPTEGKPDEAKPAEQSGAKGKKVRAALDFPADQAPLVLRIGLSAVSVEAARKNLDAEVKGFDFDAVRDEARRQWEENLSRITITTPNPTVKRTFYSALYHTMLAPTLYNDADGSYRGGDDKVHTGGGFDNYSTFSLWDTFRAEHPLLTVIEPERVNDFVRSSLAFYAQSPAHALPRWQLAKSETNCMIGYHAMPVIYDAYAKGFRDYDANLALQAMQDSALKARNCPDDYEKLGYVASLPPKNRQAASRTLEYSYDDWCISQMATALGKKDVAEHFAKRSQYFLNLFDPSTGFFRGRTANGAWTEHFDPKAVDFNNYTEANAWQYTFFAPHDLPALLKLYGREGFIQKLDECFNQESDIHHAASDVTGLIGQYSHGNEPCHNMAYLYALAGAQDKTAWHVREIMRLLYDDTPEGLCGNDDCGQMSAWYVWSAIGLYPANPADGRYVIGSPMVPSATIRLNPKYASAKTFTIVAKDVSAQNLYVKSATLNGKSLDRPWVTHDEIMHGGTLQLQMSMLPTRLWADKTP